MEPQQQAYATEIIKTLFGRDSDGCSGDVVGTYSCTYSFQRLAGRLYVSTDGLFFYSVSEKILLYLIILYLGSLH